MHCSPYLTFKMNGNNAAAATPATLHDRQYRIISELAPPWGLKGRDQIPLPPTADRQSVAARYPATDRSAPIRDFRFGYVNRSRGAPLPDEPSYDDTLTVQFYPKKVQEDWHYLFDHVFRNYIDATLPCFGRLYDEQIHTEDVASFDDALGVSSFNPDYIDWHTGVYRVWQANYWDGALCRRAFDLSPEQIVRRLSTIAARCDLYRAGVILIYSYATMRGEEIMQINGKILPALGVAIAGRRA